jgi:predicted AAA+ superfamily ATPase
MEFKLQIPRAAMVARIQNGLANSPITALLGPRQCGKTWLARTFASSADNYFDLQTRIGRVQLEDSSFRILDSLEGVVVIDEAQENPELFLKLRVLADRPQSQTRFLITGSASPGIIKGVSESLAGRVRLLALGGFNAEEAGWENWQKLWVQGGFPRSYLHQIEEESMNWRLDYIEQFLRRDLPLLAETHLTDEQRRRLTQIIGHKHGQYWIHSEAASILGVSYKTIQRHLEILKGAYILRELPPFYTNIQKRLRKAPKIYLRDSGLFHALQLIPNQARLWAHPAVGPSWEGFCIEQIISLSHSRDEECFTWSVQSGPEVDLVLTKSGGLFGFECKVSDAPSRTRSMITAVNDLGLIKLFVVYPGEKSYPVDEKIEVVGFRNLAGVLAQIG